jgi:hypothetical protein
MADGFTPSSFTPASYTAPQPPEIGTQRLANLLNLQKAQLELRTKRATQSSDIQRTQAEAQIATANAQEAQYKANIAQLNNAMSHANNAIGNLQNLRTKEDLTRDDIVNLTVDTIHNAGGNDAAIKQVLMTLPQNATKLELKAWLAQQEANAAGHIAALDKSYPQGINPAQLPTSYIQQNSQQNQTQQNTPEYSQPVSAPYAIPQAGQPRSQLPAEEGDRITGERYRQELKPIQTQYAAIRQNYDKLVDQAEVIAGSNFFSGPAGTAERALRAKIGTPEYQQLSKDLANAQIAQIKAQGGSMDTVAGQQLQGYANGSVTYDPKVLIDIARRNAANLENSYSQSFGADKASERFGDANVNRKFRTEWNKNANDNAVFEMKYIFNHAKTPEQGTKAVADYIKQSGLSPEKRKELATKYLNLQKLEKEGSL